MKAVQAAARKASKAARRLQLQLFHMPCAGHMPYVTYAKAEAHI
jgi:hypothetical protein